MPDNPGVDAEIQLVEASLDAAGPTGREATSASSGLSRKRKSEEPCTPPARDRPAIVMSPELGPPSPLPRENPNCPYAVTHAWSQGDLLEVTPLKQRSA